VQQLVGEDIFAPPDAGIMLALRDLMGRVRRWASFIACGSRGCFSVMLGVGGWA